MIEAVLGGILIAFRLASAVALGWFFLWWLPRAWWKDSKTGKETR